METQKKKLWNRSSHKWLLSKVSKGGTTVPLFLKLSWQRQYALEDPLPSNPTLLPTPLPILESPTYAAEPHHQCYKLLQA